MEGYRRPTITNLFGVGAISGQAITYFVEGAQEGDFETVGEGEEFSQIHYANATEHTDALSTIAGFIKESGDMITDLAFLKSDIAGRLLYSSCSTVMALERISRACLSVTASRHTRLPTPVMMSLFCTRRP